MTRNIRHSHHDKFNNSTHINFISKHKRKQNTTHNQKFPRNSNDTNTKHIRAINETVFRYDEENPLKFPLKRNMRIEGFLRSEINYPLKFR